MTESFVALNILRAALMAPKLQLLDVLPVSGRCQFRRLLDIIANFSLHRCQFSLKLSNRARDHVVEVVRLVNS